jgi:hypothetical protein
MKGSRRLPPAPSRTACFWAWLGVCLVLSALSPSCATAGDEARQGVLPQGSGGSTAAPAVSISFVQAPLELMPRETKTIGVKVTPEGAYEVRLSLLGAVDASAPPDDATLDRTKRISDPHGLATFQLTAPSTPTAFLLRAQVGESFLDTQVSVNPDALIHVLVNPKYAGKRVLGEWVATAAVGTTCELMSPDVPRYSVQAPLGSLELDDVPLGAELAITASAGALATGCTTLEAPLANTLNSVTVEVRDRPVDLGSTALELVFGLDARNAAFSAELDAANRELKANLRGEVASDATALLDEIELRLEAEQAQVFSVARQAAAWDSTLFERSATCLGDPVQRWQDTGRKLFLAPRAFEGRIAGSYGGEAPTFLLNRVGGAPAADASLTTQVNTWNIDTSDTLVFSAIFSWYPKGLAAALMGAPAVSETGANDIPTALASVVGCSSRGDKMSRDTRPAVVEFVASCDATCLEFACQDALVALWARATSGVPEEASALEVSASGGVTVADRDDIVEVSTLSGTWAGRLRRGRQVSSTGGALSGFRPR